MAALNDGVKRFVVQALACYDTPTQVAEAVKEEFGLDVSRQQVSAYDPTKHAGRNLSKKWRVLFEDTRKRFREEAAEVPIASRAYRLRALQRVADRSGRNVNLLLRVMEQAAKEVGDVYVNRQIGHPDDTPPPARVDVEVVDARVRPRDSDADA